MTGQTNCRRTVFPECPCIGQCFHFDTADVTIFVGTDAHFDFHFMSGRRSNEAFFSGINDFCRSACFQCDDSRIYFRYNRLFCAETAADSRFDDTNLGFGNIQCVRQDTAYMERYLCGADDVQSAVSVHLGISTEGFHHGLLYGFCVVSIFHNNITFRNDFIHIAMFFQTACAQIALVIRAYGAKCLPVIFRMHQNGIILCLVEIQHRFQHIIFYFNDFHCLIYGFFCFPCHNGNSVPNETDTFVQNQSVIGTGFGICLSCHGETLLRHVFISQNTNDTGQFFRNIFFDFQNFRMGMGAAQHLYHQAILRRNVISVNRFACYQCHGVFFPNGLIYIFHSHFAPFL